MNVSVLPSLKDTVHRQMTLPISRYLLCMKRKLHSQSLHSCYMLPLGHWLANNQSHLLAIHLYSLKVESYILVIFNARMFEGTRFRLLGLLHLHNIHTFLWHQTAFIINRIK